VDWIKLAQNKDKWQIYELVNENSVSIEGD
jgi:hypothetical protein